MRAALLILLGLAIGVIGTAQVMSALAARNPMPKAVMHTMGYHMGALKQAMKAQQCDAAKTLPHLLRLQSTATDILPTFGIADRGFSDDENKLQASLQQAIASAPANCAALATALKPVGESCQDCHQQYR
ncbi:MAG: cytochrome c [Xanthomonadaceae bacterium]|jgi:cytochrome c556|nr:cytochrome c [Xanthomonadaceae bacterium]MDE2278229.1 cytochrome c [Xanthomonadaceae bacterium]